MPLRRMLSSYTNVKRVSNFRPTVAKAIYERYSPENGTVLDPCAGFGGRLLGCLTLSRHYVGYEPNRNQYCGLKQMSDTIHHFGLTSCQVNLSPSCAEEAICQEKPDIFSLDYSKFRHEDTKSQRIVKQLNCQIVKLLNC